MAMQQEWADKDYYGTLEPFASHAVYFVVTDRFVNGDTSNDQREQGGEHRTFDIPVPCADGIDGNIGYLGGDFKGVLDNAGYIRDLGFGAVWITPIVENPDQAFTGGKPLSCGSSLTDAAPALGMSRETARHHLKQIFQKTDTHRQAQLVALVSREA
mgnify:CR=1 FL=1